MKYIDDKLVIVIGVVTRGKVLLFGTGVHWDAKKSLKWFAFSLKFLLLSVIDNFEWFWMQSLHKNIQLMQEFLKAPFLAQLFSNYTLMIFLMMLSVMLLSKLMILLSILSVIGHLICSNNLNWLLNLNLIYKTLWNGVRSSLLISMPGKLSWFLLTGLITMGLLM